MSTLNTNDIGLAANVALQQEEGITLLFAFADYPSRDTCRKAAMRFRMNFYMKRAKERKKLRDGESAFDVLVCFLEELPAGWQIKLKRETDTIRVVGGEGIRELSPEYRRWGMLQQEALTYAKLNLDCAFTDEDREFFWSYDPNGARALYDELGWDEQGKAKEVQQSVKPFRFEDYREGN